MGDLNSTDAGIYLQRFELFREVDKQRQDMVAKLVFDYQNLLAKYHEKCDDHNNEVESRRMWQDKARNAGSELGMLRRANESNPIFYVIIDGDGAYFRDEFLAKGKDGGAEAAHQLQIEIRNYTTEVFPDTNPEDWVIMVQVVLNMEGLSKTLQYAGILGPYSNDLAEFGRAFSLTQPLFSFVDVGKGKERADHKIREMLRPMLHVAQVKQIMLGPCLDTGYLPVLEPFKRDPVIGPKITLLETSPAHPGFVQLGFRRHKIPSVFRASPLPESPNVSSRSIPSRGLPATEENYNVPSKTSATTPPPSEGDSNSWAAVGKGNKVSKSIDIASKKTGPVKSYVQNAYEERLDEHLPRTDPSAERRFMERMQRLGKCCNKWHLKGKCSDGDACLYSHGDRLSSGEQLVLRHKTRSIRCPSLEWCNDPDCPLGHHCKYGKDCTAPNCRFADTHHMDLKATKRVCVHPDGSYETRSLDL